MYKGEEVYRSVEVTDSVQTSSLSIWDQIRLIFASVSNDDVAELEKNEKVSADNLSKIASLSKLLDKSIKIMQDRGEKSVCLAVSSIYKPYFNNVFNEDDGFGRFYEISVDDRGAPPGVNYDIIVRVRPKVSK